MQDKLIMATRKSPMAIWQANHVKKQLEALHSGLHIELLGLTTQGDIHLDTPLASVGGKGLFVKELEKALLDGRADIAVHSLKDVPVTLPEGLQLTTICKRDDPRDAFISNQYNKLEELPAGSIVGTSSLRRQCQLKGLRPDVDVQDLRGNVSTRLKRLDDNQFAAIILAAAGLHRVDLADRIKSYFAPEIFIPAVGQGVLAIECREHDPAILALIDPLDHPQTRVCVAAERAFNRHLDGGCHVPIGVHASISHDKLILHGMVGQPQCNVQIRASLTGFSSDAEQLGTQLAQMLLDRGGDRLLAEL